MTRRTLLLTAPALAILVAILPAACNEGAASNETARGAEAGADAAPASPPDGEPPPDAASGDADAAAQPWVTLFDGVLGPEWKMSTIKNQPGHDDPGHFEIVGNTLETRTGTDIGLLWYSKPAPASFVLELEWMQSAVDDNSGIFVRFPDLDSKGYDNTAFVAANFGFEIQIDGTGNPDGAPKHTTGAIYNEVDQTFSLTPARAIGMWNEYQIRVENQVYTVVLNGVQTTRFENKHADRGAPSPSYIGLQTHSGRVSFRKIRIRTL